MERISGCMQVGTRALAVAGIVAVLGACQIIAGSEDTVDAAPADAAPADAAPTSYVVRGTAAGLLEPVSIQLDFTGGSEMLSVLDNGPFAFEAKLGNDASFVVSVVGEAPYLLEGESGVVMGGDVQVLVACEGVMLSGLAISGPTAPSLGFAPATLTYEAEVSLLQQSTRVTATAMHAEASIAIAGMPAESGVPGPELPLALGENAIAVTVTHPRGGELTYHVTVSRAAELAQYAYGKASNVGAGDGFGWSAALSGDTLAVGALYEASAATGVGGNQTNNSALGSGAIYIFH